jgi:hypothetical protein
MTGTSIMPSYWLRWGLKNYLQGWPQTMIFLIAASQVPKIIDLSHWQLAGKHF